MMWVIFIELAGAAAAEVLLEYQQGLPQREHYRASRLLHNADDDLYLLVTEWREKVILDVPEDTRVWTFMEYS